MIQKTQLSLTQYQLSSISSLLLWIQCKPIVLKQELYVPILLAKNDRILVHTKILAHTFLCLTFLLLEYKGWPFSNDAMTSSISPDLVLYKPSLFSHCASQN